MTDDRAAFRDLAERYALAADRHRPELLDAIMTADAVVEGPGFALRGVAEIRGIPAMLAQRFRGTRHLVYQQSIAVAGDTASGETMATADHLLRETAQVLVWHFRYQEVFRRERGTWRFARRTIVIDCTETRDVQVPA